jgi:hypothetical protein
MEFGVHMTNQNRRGKATVLPFRQSPGKHTIEDVKELRAQLRCVERVIQILEGLAAKTETSPANDVKLASKFVG